MPRDYFEMIHTGPLRIWFSQFQDNTKEKKNKLIIIFFLLNESKTQPRVIYANNNLQRMGKSL